jgi:hypothetical protein
VDTNTYLHARRKRRFVFPFEWKKGEGQDKTKVGPIRVLDGTDEKKGEGVAIDIHVIMRMHLQGRGYLLRYMT